MKKTGIVLFLMLLIIEANAQKKRYFPVTGKDTLDSFKSSWYSGQLEALKEPVLYNQNGIDVYRFTWLRSFDPPIVIRIEKRSDGTFILLWKQDSSNAGYPPAPNYHLIIDNQRYITRENWDTFLYKLKHTNFWKLPTKEKFKLGTDGAEWILEASITNKYHVVDRWSPDKGTAYYQCCDYLLSLTGLAIPTGRKY